MPLFNQGTAGIGNVAILHKMLAWKLEYGFHDTDLVLVNWSNFNREDRIKNGYWRSGGNVVTSRFYNEKFVRNYWDEENDFVKNAGAIIKTLDEKPFLYGKEDYRNPSLLIRRSENLND
mgnify:CR=1 FL=1